MVSTDLQHFNNFKQFHVELIEQQCFDFIFCIETGLKAEGKTLYLKLNVSLWTYFFRFVTVTDHHSYAWCCENHYCGKIQRKNYTYVHILRFVLIFLLEFALSFRFSFLFLPFLNTSLHRSALLNSF